MNRAIYPIAHVRALKSVFKGSILIGYDIGCGFSATISPSQFCFLLLLLRHGRRVVVG